MRWLQRRSATKRRPAAPPAAAQGGLSDDDLSTAEAWDWEHVDGQSCAGFSSEGSFSCHDVGDLDGDPWPHLEEGFRQEESTGLSVPPQCRMARPGFGPLLGQWADSIGHTVAATVAGAVGVPALASCCRPPVHLMRVDQGPSDRQGAEEDPLDLVASGCLAPVGWCCGDGSKLGSCMRTTAAPTWGEVVRESVADWMFYLDE